MGIGRPFRNSRTEPVFVGFAGRIGAGKTTAAEYLRSRYGFQYARYSRTLRAWLASETTDPKRVQEIGWEVMAGGRQPELNARLIGELTGSASAAIDGLRHPIDHESLSLAFDGRFHMIFLEAAAEIRFCRKRERFSTFAEFLAADSQPVEAQIEGLKPLAAAIVANESSMDSLRATLDRLVGGRLEDDR